MRMFVRFVLFLCLVVALGALGGLPAIADGHLGEIDTASPDAASELKANRNSEIRSRNMKFMSNSPRTSAVSQSDLAFWGDLAFAGNYDGFRIIDTSAPGAAKVLADVDCRGPQNDVSVWGFLLFLSVDRPQMGEGCDSGDTPSGVTGFEGIRIFDVSDPTDPAFVTGVATDCGSHTHTLIPDPDNNRVLLYVSSYPSSFLGPTPFGTDCRRLNPDGTQGHSKISIVAVPLDAPETAAVVAQPTFELGDFRSTPGFRGCHDISVFLEPGIAAAACLSEGQVWDISDPLAPVTIHRVHNPAVDIWHSAAFTYDAGIVIFGDEFAGGGGPGCSDPDDDIGRIWFYDLAAPVEPLGSYKIPRAQGAQICTMHNFNVIPMTDRYILVSASNDGGTTVVDFTDPAAPQEIAFFDAQLEAGERVASPWSSYWYNNFIYVNDRGRGVDVLLLSDGARAGARTFPYLNPQTQEFTIQ